MNSKKILTVVIVAVVLLLAVVGALWGESFVTYNPTPVDPVVIVDEEGHEVVQEAPVGDTADEPVIFSLAPGFYTAEEKLYLSAPDAVEIRYTKDGNDPWEKGAKRYKDGISMKPSDKEKAKPYTIKACAVYEDGSHSEAVSRTYFFGKDIADRYDTLIVSITVDPDVLYDYETGIFVAGKLRDDFLATKPDKEIVPTDPANWNWRGRASERECYVEVYEYDGDCVISQAAGMRIFGGWSRAGDTKNIRIYAREEYDLENNRFRYEFFPDALDANGRKITSYNKLSLRTCANDAGSLYMRDDMISAMAHTVGVDAKYSRPVAVYLNGEYYCFAWCQQTFSEDLLEHTYAIEQAEWDILKGCEYMIWEDDDNDIVQATADWHELYSYAYKDLTIEENFNYVDERLDIDNFMRYYALNSYLGNGDWPNNNWKIYRYKSGTAEEGTYPCDGKWRFMLYDTDFCLGLYGNDFFTQHMQWLFNEEYFGLQPNDWVIDVHDDGTKYQRSDLLISLCKREDMREKWLNILCDMAYWHYSEDRLLDYIDEFNTWRLHELVEASNLGRANVWSVSRELDIVKEYAEARPLTMQTQMTKVFPEYKDLYNVYISPTKGATIHISSCDIRPDDEYTFGGKYFVGCEQVLDCTPAAGYEFVAWEINGERITDKQTVISSEKYGNKASVKLITENKNADIIISEVSYKGSDADYISLYNPTDEDITLKNYIISDGNSSFTIPTTTVKAHRTVKILGKNYNKADALGNITCGFSLKEFETVTLRNGEGELVQSVYLNEGTKNTVSVYDSVTDTWFERTREPKDRLIETELPGHGGWGWGW